jgi:hypothetical protein
MNVLIARDLATASHMGQRTRSGELVLEHLARVAAAVGPGEQATAWLHDILERCEPRLEELRALGLTEVEGDALELLTRYPSECFELHALRIAHASGEAGRVARSVRLADLDDHLRHPALAGDPPYAWARRHIANACGHDAQPPAGLQVTPSNGRREQPRSRR